jgi:uracil phosphoribosyltransferase
MNKKVGARMRKKNKTIKIEKPWYHVIIETKYITHQVTTKRTKNKTNALKRCFDTIIDWLAEEAIPNSQIIKTSTGYRVETANGRNVCECYILDSWN